MKVITIERRAGRNQRRRHLPCRTATGMPRRRSRAGTGISDCCRRTPSPAGEMPSRPAFGR